MFHRHCFAWVRVDTDELALMCVHCWDLQAEEPKVLGEWWEMEGDDERLKASQAAFAKAHKNGCVQNDYRDMKARQRRRPAPAWA